MYLFITILIVIAAILLILIVLVQNSKGGGLSSGFSSSNQIMGVRKTTDFLEKATWSLAGFVVILSIVASAFTHPAQESQKSEIEIQELPVNQGFPAAPTQQAAPTQTVPVEQAPAAK